MRNMFFKNQRGFTVTELLIATAVASVFGAAFFGAFYMMNAQSHRNHVTFDINISVKNALDRIAHDVEEATSIVVSYTPAGGATSTTGDNVLVLQLPAIDGSGAPISSSSDFDYVIYKLSNAGKLLRSIYPYSVAGVTSARDNGLPAVDAVVASNVSGIFFSWNAASGVGAGLSTVAVNPSALTSLRWLNVRVASRGAVLGNGQELQVDADMLLANKIF